MKKVLFALPALAFTLFLTFCQKNDTQETIAPTSPGNTGVSDRTPCTLLVNAGNSNVLEICGLQTNLNYCAFCDSTPVFQGVEYCTTSGSYLVNSPLTFSIRNTGTTGTKVKVGTGTGNATDWISILAGDCRTYSLDNNCNITSW